jgi:hypothetical protein
LHVDVLLSTTANVLFNNILLYDIQYNNICNKNGNIGNIGNDGNIN